MFFVMIEISNFRQLARLRAEEAAQIHGLLEHFCNNRGGRLAREQNGFFLFAFNPQREKVLEQVSDFLFLTSESLQRKKEDLFGFSLLLDWDEPSDEGAVFNRLKTLIFMVPRESRIWAAPGVLSSLTKQFPVSEEHPLAEILGPPVKATLEPLPIELLLEMTGWIEALKTPLSRQLSEVGEHRPGKILRLKGTNLTEKYFVLKTVLHQIYGAHEDFPVLFPLRESRDFLSQLLARVNPHLWKDGPKPSEPAWEALLECRGGGDYPGDSGRDDVVGALGHYFRAVIRHLKALGLPPVFVFMFPDGYEPEAQAVLETILGDLVSREGMRLLLLEHQEASFDFLGRQPSLTWSFPALSLERIVKERDSRGWKDRFPLLDRAALEACQGQGMAWVHYLWHLQAHTYEPFEPLQGDPSWQLFESLDLSHHKVFFVLCESRGLLEEHQLVEFFQQWGEDSEVIQDKVESLQSMGFLLGGLSRPLRPDFGPRLASRLGPEAKTLLTGLGKFLYAQWKTDRRLSEVLFAFLRDQGLHNASVEVLSYYLTNKINQGQGDFLPLLRKELWETAPTEELKESYRLVAAASKLRFALNLRSRTGLAPDLERFKRYFTKRTESNANGEWQLQQGRLLLRVGDLAQGFSLLKKALLEAQERDDRSLEVRAETEIGLALLRKNRLVEGREYFDIASRLAERTGSSYLVTLTTGLDSVALFLLGHLSGSLQALNRGSAAAERGGLRHGKVFHSFLRGRIAFDLGDYTGAQASLQEGLRVAQTYHLVEALPVLNAWKARALAHAGDGHGARALLAQLQPSAERDFFWAESLYFERELAAALEKVGQARSALNPTRPFGAGERMDWDTGFSAIEDRCLAAPGDQGVLSLQIEAFEVFLQGLLGEPAEAARRFQEILAQKFLLELDPASAVYFYWYYMVIPKNDARQEAQRLTLLGRSLKDVQVRSSRIEDPLQRQDFLSKPHWNAQFALEARKLKLL